MNLQKQYKFMYLIFLSIHTFNIFVNGETNPCKDSVYQALFSKSTESLSKKEARILAKKDRRCAEYSRKLNPEDKIVTEKKTRTPRQTIKRRIKEIKESKLSTIFVASDIIIDSNRVFSYTGEDISIVIHTVKPGVHNIGYSALYKSNPLKILQYYNPRSSNNQNLMPYKKVELKPGCAYYAGIELLSKISSETIGNLKKTTYSAEAIFKELDDNGIKRYLIRSKTTDYIRLILVLSFIIMAVISIPVGISYYKNH